MATKFNCPIRYALDIIGGRWKIIILWNINKYKIIRYGEIKKRIPEISHKVLSQQLKELESDGIVYRNEYYEIPPKVEYSLTDKGHSLIPIVEIINEWGQKNMSC
ncbi:winged helix-turn-helix transcriptional regulator [Alkaliphilus hydrothermalis]|uniref:DNA-binding HxlR family transcriptional regulator n=1 Tax=Alkaliphilus hydrothermalis TaxID=1482730 RepID=A0ABS2NSD6_9FIRM|nr:helix-turn-helix domain-containing protein [Alkaliphilus hydrothermalis]MBM7615862.1 DNA-binding HxlR family transcriptional regulator [Alkaliphilus hydrothermalis]